MCEVISLRCLFSLCVSDLCLFVKEIPSEREADDNDDPADIKRRQTQCQSSACVTTDNGGACHGQSIGPYDLAIDHESGPGNAVDAECQPGLEGVHFVDIAQVEKRQRR